MKHTKGPWKLQLNGNGSYRIGLDHLFDIVICHRSEWNSRVEESEANGRLIAAAPELLEAAIRYYKSFSVDGGLCTQCFWLATDGCKNKECGKYDLKLLIEQTTGEEIE